MRVIHTMKIMGFLQLEECQNLSNDVNKEKNDMVNYKSITNKISSSDVK